MAGVNVVHQDFSLEFFKTLVNSFTIIEVLSLKEFPSRNDVDIF